MGYYADIRMVIAKSDRWKIPLLYSDKGERIHITNV